MPEHADTVRPPRMACEGSGFSPARPGWPLCAMCGHSVGLDRDGLCVPHERLDILGWLDGRGGADHDA